MLLKLSINIVLMYYGICVLIEVLSVTIVIIKLLLLIKAREVIQQYYELNKIDNDQRRVGNDKYLQRSGRES